MSDVVDTTSENTNVTEEHSQPRWSIIIPAYNEELRLGDTLSSILDYMDKRDGSFEILVIDDGSSDGTVQLVRDNFPGVRLLKNKRNRGKGHSVKVGMTQARGAYLLFSDADLSTPIEELERFEQSLDNGADMVIASRAMEDSQIEVHQAIWRESAGRCFNLLVRTISGLPFHDTQCGFKAYRRETAHQIAELQRLEGWAFDVEQLRLALLLGLTVQEVPVRWINSEQSRVNLLRDAPLMLLDIIRVRLTRYDFPQK